VSLASIPSAPADLELIAQLKSKLQYAELRIRVLEEGSAADAHREAATWCYTLTIMPQFVIEREIPGAGKMSESEIRQVSLRSLQVLKEMGPRIQWLHSYVTEDKVYCVYLAPDEDSIREHARSAGIPADRVAAVRRLIDPANLK
jgi:Protein of unknown function (DUF4242)